MTPAERAEWLDRVAEADDPPEPEEYEDFDPLTAAGRTYDTEPTRYPI